MGNVIDLEKYRNKDGYLFTEDELVEIVITRRQVEDIAINIVMDFAHLWDIETIIAERIFKAKQEEEDD